MTTHWSEEHQKFIPCWEDASQRLLIFQSADLILYTSEEVPSHQLERLSAGFRTTTVHLYENPGYQEGAVKALVDGFTSDWFEGYDWVIRLNPDVLIRDDTWIRHTLTNSSVDAILHNCHHQAPADEQFPVKIQTDFFAVRPSVVNSDRIFEGLQLPELREKNTTNAELHWTYVLHDVLAQKRFKFLHGGYSPYAMCRVQGWSSPVVHVHELASACPYYYDAHSPRPHY